jgi:hypothetical protein
MSNHNPGAAINALQDYVAQARTFHARVDAIVSALSQTDDAALAARDNNIAMLADIVKRYAGLQL